MPCSYFFTSLHNFDVICVSFIHFRTKRINICEQPNCKIVSTEELFIQKNSLFVQTNILFVQTSIKIIFTHIDIIYGPSMPLYITNSISKWTRYQWNCIVSVNETSSTGMLATQITTDKDSDYTNNFVDVSTPSQEILERNNKNTIKSTSGNLIQRNWKLITIILLVLSCIVLSLTYCQPTFIRIRELFTRLVSTSQP